MSEMFVRVLCSICLVVNMCTAVEEYVVDQEYYKSLGYTGPKPTFSKKVYTVRVDGISFELVDPIVLDNCDSIDTIFDVDTSKSDYVPIPGEHALNVSSDCTLMFPLIFMKTKGFSNQPFGGFITIRALHNKYVLDVTSLVLIPKSDPRDIRIIFEVDGTEYIILNYFYLKITFISILLITAFILAIEIKEIHNKFTTQRYKHLETNI
ncbi:uncharacterized protein LOC126885267 [Diabrotica virgifera virgifera]|uniref:Uncharacterized protein LOC114345366 n=1 Tax=Diabrotica virgifera virgifera TaxID=50390 RepID=A0A6P7GQZ1_DIAVI|nr:uncharacterized protein LOC126885267 [Diabrotica virgifera virgifera]